MKNGRCTECSRRQIIKIELEVLVEFVERYNNGKLIYFKNVTIWLKFGIKMSSKEAKGILLLYHHSVITLRRFFQ